MTNEDQLKSLWLSHEQIRQLSTVLSDNEARKDFTCQLRQQGYYAIFASDEGPVYESGVKRTVILEHTLGYFRPGEICDEAPSAEQRRHQYAEIERNLSTLVMEHGGVVLSICDDEPDEPEEDEDDFQECTFVECEFPTREDAESATACILDCWSTLGVDVFDEKGKILEGGYNSLSSSQGSARTNKSPEKRVPNQLVSLANRSRERRETLLMMREEGRHGKLPLETEIELWYAARDVLFNRARISWLEAGLPPDPTDEQLDQWMGGNHLHSGLL